MARTPYWEMFQREVLDDLGVGGQFTNRGIAAKMGVGWSEASGWINLYLEAQRRPRSKTKYVLHRRGRTSNAVWTIGARTKDARERLGQFGDDVKRTIKRAVVRDLVRHKKINPRARVAIEEGMEPLLDGFVTQLDAVVRMAGFIPDE